MVVIRCYGEKMKKSSVAEKDVASCKALSVARHSCHEAEVEQGHSLRVSPNTVDTAFSESTLEKTLNFMTAIGFFDLILVAVGLKLLIDEIWNYV